MEEEKRSIGDTLAFLSNRAAKFFVKYLPGVVKARNERLNKKVERLEGKKKALEENILVHNQNQSLSKRLKELKEDISFLKSYDKDKFIAKFNELVVDSKTISEKSNGLFQDNKEANNILVQLENYIQDSMKQYNITVREAKGFEDKGMDLTDLHKRIEGFEKNINMMLHEYSQTFDYFKGLNVEGLKDAVDFKNVFNNVKSELLGNVENKQFVSQIEFNIKDEIKKIKEENLILGSKKVKNEAKVNELKKQRDNLYIKKYNGLGDIPKEILKHIRDKEVGLKDLMNIKNIKNLIDKEIRQPSVFELGKYDANVVKEYFGDKNLFNSDNLRKILSERYKDASMVEKEAERIMNRIETLIKNGIVSKNGNEYSFTKEGLQKLKGVDTSFEYTSYDANVVNGYIDRAKGSLTLDKLKELLSSEYQGKDEVEKQLKYLSNRLENNVKGGYAVKNIVNGTEVYSLSNKGIEAREKILSPETYKIKQYLEELKKGKFITQNDGGYKLSDKMNSILNPEKQQTNISVSKEKQENYIDLESKIKEMDSYDYTNKDNPSFVIVEEVSNSVESPDKFTFKGNVEDVKFFNDKNSISFSDIKALDSNGSGVGKDVFKNFLDLKEKGYLNVVNDPKNFGFSKFEITEEGKKYIKESNFINVEKSSNKIIKESTKIKSTAIER